MYHRYIGYDITSQARKVSARAFVRGTDFSSVYDFSIWFRNCSYSVGFRFVFCFITTLFWSLF